MRNALGNAFSGASGGAGSSAAIRRITRELKEISESPSRHWTAAPAGDDLFEWQFAIRGPPGTDFEGGIYTGRLALPVDYPLKPPSIMLLTPNGRWEVNKKICLSNTNYHPDLWQPAWGIRTMMEALRSHFPVAGEGAIGALDWPSDLRKKLAKESLDFVTNSDGKRNRELLPELSLEELKEDQPEPVPPELRAPAISAEAAAARRAAAAAAAPGAAAPADAGADAPTADAAAEAAGPDGEGMRHRMSTISSVGPSVSELPTRMDSGLVAPAPTMQTVASSAAGGSSSPTAAQPRRRREGQQGQRRAQRPLMVQLLKPPESSRGWVLVSINFMIAMLMLSFLLTLTDIVRHPPQLLDQLPDSNKE